MYTIIDYYTAKNNNKLQVIAVNGFKHHRIQVIFLCLLLSLFGLAKAQEIDSQNTLEEVVIELKWRHQFQFAGYYAALEKGFFADEGLAVTLVERNPSTNIINRVLSGHADYGVSDSILILQQANGAPIALVAAIFQHSANAILSLAKSGIEEPRDLINRRVSFYDSGSEGVDLLALMASQGVANPNLVRQRWDERIDALLSGEVDAITSYITNEPYQLRMRGYAINVLYPRHFGFDFYGDMLFTSATELEQNPERVAAIRRAVIKGWEYALAHPEELVELILERYNTQNKTRSALLFEAQGISSLISQYSIPLGTIDPARIRFLQQRMQNLGLVVEQHGTEDILLYSDDRRVLNLTVEERNFLASLPPIRFAVEERGWEPFEIIDQYGRFKGISADYLAHISAILDVEFEHITTSSWLDVLELGRNREIDIFPSAAATPERRDYMNFTAPFARSPMVVITRDNVDYIPALGELTGKLVGVVEGYASDELLRYNYPDIELSYYNATVLGLRALASGEIDAFVDNLAVANFLIKKEGLTNLKISGQAPFTYDLSIGVRSDWPLLASAIGKALATITPEEHAAIYNRWVQLSLTQQVSWRNIWPYALGVVVVFIILFVYLLRLRALHEQLSATNNKLLAVEVELREKNEELQVLSTTDKLTGVYNRRYLDGELTSAFAYAKRSGKPLSVALFDLDHFKRVNDVYGHAFGDVVLQKFATLVRENVRASDTFGRWGGEEFLLICRDTSAQDACYVADKIRTLFMAIEYPEPIQQTVSAGVADDAHFTSIKQLIRHADDNLYRAKQNGRNQVV